MEYTYSGFENRASAEHLQQGEIPIQRQYAHPGAGHEASQRHSGGEPVGQYPAAGARTHGRGFR